MKCIIGIKLDHEDFVCKICSSAKLQNVYTLKVLGSMGMSGLYLCTFWQIQNALFLNIFLHESTEMPDF